MFKGMDFIFNDIPSETYGLKIGFFDGGGIEDGFSGIKRSIDEYRIKNKSKPIYQGVEVTNKIAFELVVYSETELDTYDRQAIDNWLYLNNYAFFSIVQADYENIFFNCMITDSTKISIGNIPYAKRLQIECDDAFAYTNEYTYSFTSTTTSSTQEIKNIGNVSEYVYPTDMSITMNSSGTCKITNTSESSRLFEITNLSSGEVLAVDNENKILDSSVSSDRIQYFNKKWFRLVPYSNMLTLNGNFTLTIKVRFRITI